MSGPPKRTGPNAQFGWIRTSTKQLGRKLVLYGSEPDQTTRTEARFQLVYGSEPDHTTRTEARFVRFGTKPNPDQTTRCGALFKTARARQSTKSITSERSGTGNRARAGVLSKPQNLHPRAPSKLPGHARAPKASRMSVLEWGIELEPACCQNFRICTQDS